MRTQLLALLFLAIAAFVGLGGYLAAISLGDSSSVSGLRGALWLILFAFGAVGSIVVGVRMLLSKRRDVVVRQK